MTNYIYCVDWGTSSLRIRLVETITHEIVDQITNSYGISRLFADWQQQDNDASDINERVSFYLAYLEKQISVLASRNDKDLNSVPMVISGMASSSLGILELPYAKLPFALNGENAVIHSIGASTSFNRQVIVLSGVRSENEVMRGEETQLVGIANSVAALQIAPHATVLLPGTHSKHVRVKDGCIQGIETYITGELFGLLAKNSVLRESLKISGDVAGDENWKEAFSAGVKYATTTSLLQGLFKIRTNQLFNKFDKKQNYSYLSGLLIGHELCDLLKTRDAQIFLCSAHNLYEQYKLALEELGLASTTYVVDPAVVDQATVKGQIMMAEPYLVERITR